MKTVHGEGECHGVDLDHIGETELKAEGSIDKITVARTPTCTFPPMGPALKSAPHRSEKRLVDHERGGNPSVVDYGERH